MAEAELDTPVHQHRSRLLEGMAQAVAARGYAETTIADVVREAAVSRRTFYEHFSTKAECLVALYEAASHNALKVLRDALDSNQAWETQVESAMAAYLGCIAQSPALVRTLFIEILGLGTEGLAVRRRMNQEIADFILAVVNRGHPGQLSPAMAMAIVGGINELVLEYMEQDRVRELHQLVGPASALVRAVAGAQH